MQSTGNITLTGEWRQITTGTETVFIQSVSGTFAFCISETTPIANQAYHVFSEQTVTPPTKAWVKSFTSGLKASISYM